MTVNGSCSPTDSNKIIFHSLFHIQIIIIINFICSCVSELSVSPHKGPGVTWHNQSISVYGGARHRRHAELRSCSGCDVYNLTQKQEPRLSALMLNLTCIISFVPMIRRVHTHSSGTFSSQTQIINVCLKQFYWADKYIIVPVCKDANPDQWMNTEPAGATKTHNRSHLWFGCSW